VGFVCPESRCPFSSSSAALPILVVDEDLYDTPPTLMIGTIDKFAMLAWRPEARSLFGLGGRGTSPPDLIVQDELHLLAGPLGSMAGLYEAAVELLSSWDGHAPKLIASTATIRGAGAQTLALYNREVREFPPPGIDIDDSFFARRETGAPSRLYVGVHSPSRSRVMTELRVAASLLQAVRSIALPAGAPEVVRDPYWTLVEYFGSLRELGLSATLALNEYVEQMRVIERRLALPLEQRRYLHRIIELTSRRSADEIPRLLAELAIAQVDAQSRAVDLLLATNMISVGVDVDRLGLMLVMGQPRSTAEYIQATSRVGRSSRAPGLVVSLFAPGRPRDKSHYERFREFHGSFYRFVEPSTVTPYSVPSMERALHALLVIAARQLERLDTPADFEPRCEAVERLRGVLRGRVENVEPEHAELLEDMLTALADFWGEVRPAEFGSLGNRQPDDRPLMFPAGRDPGKSWRAEAWPVGMSMRHVDADCLGAVLTRYPAKSKGSTGDE
jgi:hypothetical protein